MTAEKIIEVSIAGETLRLYSPDRDTGELYWHMLWPSAIGLAEYLVGLGREHLEGVRILELGCGLGLVGIIAARLGAQVTLSDIDDEALSVTRRNLVLNGVDTVETMALDWRDPPQVEPYALVIGSDLIYDPMVLEPLLKTIDVTLALDGSLLFADPIRMPFTAFLVYARAHGFEHLQELFDVPIRRRTHRIGVYTIRRRA